MSSSATQTIELDIRFFATLRLKLASRGVRYGGPPLTIGELLDWLDENVDERISSEMVEPDRSIRLGTMMLVNGYNVLHSGGMETLLEGGRVDLWPPSAGG